MSAVARHLFFRAVYCFCLVLGCSCTANGGENEFGIEGNRRASGSVDPFGEFESRREKYVFSGLASYYNSIRFYVVGKEVSRQVYPGETLALDDDSWFAVSARFEVLLVQVPELELPVGEWESTLEYLRDRVDTGDVRIVGKSNLRRIFPKLDELRYAHLWTPVSFLARSVEYLLTLIHAYVVGHWGLAIVVLSMLLAAIIYPVHAWIVRMQDEIGRVRSVLEPKLAEIKAIHTGEEAHHRIVDAYGSLGVTPFYALKPLLGVLVQIPIWIAVFNALGEMPQLEDQTFLWIDDLAVPDVVGVLPFDLPLLGSTIHLLPFVMVGVGMLSAWTLQSKVWSRVEYARQKRNQYWLVMIWFFLFYTFPATLVLYWTLSILWQIGARLVVRAATVLE